MSTTLDPSAPVTATATASTSAAAWSPNNNINKNNNNSGPINDEDVEHWKARFNDVLSRPGEHINSKSPPGAIGWATRFFDCFNPLDLCLITCCLPCVTFGKTAHRVRNNGSMEGYEPINTSCLLFCGFGCCGLHFIPNSMQRAHMREKYNLEGSCIGDMARSYCCGCCNLMQLEKESTHREELLRNANGSQQPYKSNADMVYPGAN